MGTLKAPGSTPWATSEASSSRFKQRYDACMVSKGPQVGFKRTQVGSKLAQIGLKLVQKLPTLVQVGSKLAFFLVPNALNLRVLSSIDYYKNRNFPFLAAQALGDLSICLQEHR